MVYSSCSLLLTALFLGQDNVSAVVADPAQTGVSKHFSIPLTAKVVMITINKYK